MSLETELPKPTIRAKRFDPKRQKEALSLGFDPILARVLASRQFPPDFPMISSLIPKLKDLFSPFKMQDMDKAADRVVAAIIKGEEIGIETDHDCDGQTAHSVLYHNLIHVFGHPAEKVHSYIGHRLTEGYGLSQSVAKRIIEADPQVSLVITADNGSSDEAQIALLKQQTIDVIVTDHHQIPKEGIPKSAFACLNPTRSDCSYADPYIAGCMVAWLLMAATRHKLIQANVLPKTTPTLTDTLDFVAVGTVADCVSIARSLNNRIVVSHGLRLLNEGNRSCWRAIKTRVEKSLSSEDLGFRVGPLLNSDGRLADAFGSVNFLLSESDDEAMAHLLALEEHNQNRKKIQKGIVQEGLVQAQRQFEKGQFGLCVYLETGHTGVHGIAASRLKELYGRPTVFLAPKVGLEDLVSGSVRGIDGFDVRKALQVIADQSPELFVAFGGHHGAGGVTLAKKDIIHFSNAFDKAVRLQLQPSDLGAVVFTEGELNLEQINFTFLDNLARLEPFGREFEYPIFETVATIRNIRFIGDGTHARIQLAAQNHRMSAIWFGCRQSVEGSLAVAEGDQVKVAFTPKINYFRGKKQIDLHIAHTEKMIV